jgi:hypothetical protein
LVIELGKEVTFWRTYFLCGYRIRAKIFREGSWAVHGGLSSGKFRLKSRFNVSGGDVGIGNRVDGASNAEFACCEGREGSYSLENHSEGEDPKHAIFEMDHWEVFG